MSLERIEKTLIWSKTLACVKKDKDSTKRDELRTSFLKFRENASYLVSKISSVLPELTQHDISHLDALWETASLIVGNEFQITPLEGFVLGGAILVHDSALCFEAFENGKNGLRNTIQWKDAFADIIDKYPDIPTAQLEKQADFWTLRQLHAQQAETLLSRKWIDPDNGQEIYLLENFELRKHFGKFIGQIAASHNWDIETVISVLPNQINVLAGYPRDWRIDPIKIACILRCADAAHLDQERAPDFLHALLRRSGVSLNHWKSQNRLAAVDYDQSDTKQESLLFTSTIDFKEEDSAAWYVAYDAICLVDKEIKSCNSLLENRNGYTFKIKKVKGIECPETMAQFIKPLNWKPCSAMVHVGNIEKVILNLGGEKLYGTGSDLLEIVLRELIQNARDSIRARSVFDSDFEGKISIKLEKEGDSYWLIVEDNGIGMSERVLTNSLLDFGTSFWTSNLVQSEFPGLRASKFRPIGKFGIGFYSVFMIAEQVIVASKNWNKGLPDINQLKFSNGFSLRPILSKGELKGFSTLISTQLKLKLKNNIIPSDLMIEIKNNRMDYSIIKVPFRFYLSTLCAGLDVSVFHKYEETELKVHESVESANFKKEEWLIDISFAEFQASNKTKEYISANIHRLQPIVENDRLIGMAAISTINDEPNFLSTGTIGGLAQSVHNRSSSYFIGFIDYVPKSAKRDTGEMTASEALIKNWAEKQMEELLKLNLNPVEKYFASTSLCHFKVDPTNLAQILVSFNNQNYFMTIESLAELTLKMGLVFLDSGLGGGHMETHHNIQVINGFALVKPLSNSSFLSLKLVDNVPVNDNSILDCVFRYVISKGYTPKISKINQIEKNLFGRYMDAIVLSSIKN